jgi:hypothetical protein
LRQRALTVQVPNHSFAPATFNGSICYQPLAGIVTATGSMAMGSLSGSGTATIQTSGRFICSGWLMHSQRYSFANATIRVRQSGAGAASMNVSGTLSVPGFTGFECDRQWVA